MIVWIKKGANLPGIPSSLGKKDHWQCRIATAFVPLLVRAVADRVVSAAPSAPWWKAQLPNWRS